MRRLFLLLMLTLSFVLGSTHFAVIHAQEGESPTFEEADCPFSLPLEAAEVRCGYVAVPLDRNQADSPTIRLAVAVFVAETDTPAPDPLIYLDGGPGGRTLDTVVFNYDRLIKPHLAYRDVIVFDQRGIGFSEPNLECEELKAFNFALFEDNRPIDDILEDYRDVVQRCREELSARIDLNAINSTQNAADVADIMDALGYESYNLYGISYGTMLAQYVIRDHSEKIRSVVLDSNVPLTIDLYELIPLNFERALNTLQEACALNTECNTNYPDLASVLDTLYDELNANPIIIEITNPLDGASYNVYVNGDRLLNTIFSALYSADTFPLIPRTIYDLQQGNTTLLSQLLLLDIIDLSFSTDAMYAAVMCNDEIGFNDPNEYADNIAATRAILQSLYSTNIQNFFWLCELFDDGQQPQDIDNQVVQSDIPTLVMSGAFDPITPPEWGDLIAEGFSNSYVYVYPNAGHGASISSECATQMLIAFLNDPTTPPDDSCINTLAVSFNVPFSGDALEFSTRQFVDALGTALEADLPSDWEEISEGTFSPPNNLTLGVSILLFPVDNVDMVINSLSSNISFDNPIGMFTIGGREWQIFNTELQGNSTIIALAPADDNGVFVVLLIASAEELENLRTVVLDPILASIRIAE